MKPTRIQLSRAKGFRLPVNTVSVARPGKWGNPYTVEEFGLDLALKLFENSVRGGWSPALLDHLSDELCARAYAIHRAFQIRHQNLLASTFELRGKSLACWCALPSAGEADLCHAAILLRISNEGLLL